MHLSSNLLEAAVKEFSRLPGIGKKNGTETGASLAKTGGGRGVAIQRNH